MKTMMLSREISKIDYTIIICTDMLTTKTFYKDTLGFEIIEDLDTWVSFQVGPNLLTLRPRGSSPVCDDGPIPSGSAATQLAFCVPLASIDRCYEDLVGKGVRILRGPTDLPKWRHRTVFFADPENNIIEIYAHY